MALADAMNRVPTYRYLFQSILSQTEVEEKACCEVSIKAAPAKIWTRNAGILPQSVSWPDSSIT
jgi:hypothetical protein